MIQQNFKTPTHLFIAAEEADPYLNFSIKSFAIIL